MLGCFSIGSIVCNLLISNTLFCSGSWTRSSRARRARGRRFTSSRSWRRQASISSRSPSSSVRLVHGHSMIFHENMHADKIYSSFILVWLPFRFFKGICLQSISPVFAKKSSYLRSTLYSLKMIVLVFVSNTTVVQSKRNEFRSGIIVHISRVESVFLWKFGFRSDFSQRSDPCPV